MGLDSVELLMEVEKHFGISIPDIEAETIRTIGDFHNTVWKYIKQKPFTKCKSQIVFNALRRYSVNSYTIPRLAFTTHIAFDDIVPRANRRSVYKKMEAELGLYLPKLVLPKAWQSLLEWVGITTIGISLAVVFIMVTFLDYSKWYYLLPCAGIAFTQLISALLNFKRVVIEQPTMREFIGYILYNNAHQLPTEYGTNRREVEQLLNIIIVEKLGVSPEEVSPEKSFTDDLGVD